MFPTHPDLMGQLAKERAASLRAEAQRHRRRPVRAGWRPARFVEPAADLSRVLPVPAEPLQTPRTDRAA
ncbi:MAG TPA: hypothetical protein VHK02_11535 [Actinomycetota bacterium]|jgi:hypothetical protein|nr:hypothetical protein [Actinomycetota bacterium]